MADFVPPSKDTVVQSGGFTPPATDTVVENSFTPPVQDHLLARVRASSVDDLTKDVDFDPIGSFNLIQNSATPEDTQKLVDVYKNHRTGGFNARRFAAGAKEVPGAVGDLFVGAAKTARNVVKGFAPKAPDKEGQDEAAKSRAELTSALDAAGAADAGLLHSGLRKLAGLPMWMTGPIPRLLGKAVFDENWDPKSMTPEDWRSQFFNDAALQQTHEEATKGEGPLAQFLGNDADSLEKAGVKIDREAFQKSVSQISGVTDPINIIPFGAGFEVAVGPLKVLTAPTRELAEKMAARLGNLTQRTGQAVAEAGASMRRPSVAAATGGLAAGHPGAAAALAAPYAVRGIGRGVEKVGDVLAGESALSRPIARVAEEGAVGAASAAPFAAAQDDERNMAPILGVGATLGAAGGEFARAKEKVGGAIRTKADSIVGKDLEPQIKPGAIKDSPAYGRDATLDQAHAQQMQAIRQQDPSTADAVNRVRAILPAIHELHGSKGPSPELYVLPPEVFDSSFPGAKGQAGFIENKNNQVFIRGSNPDAVNHETGHLLASVLPPEVREKAVAAIEQAYGDKGIQQFADNYEQWFAQQNPGQTSVRSREYYVDEILAEHLNAMLRADRLDGLPKDFRNTAGELLEYLGAYKPELVLDRRDSTVTPLGVKVSPTAINSVADFFKGTLGSDKVKAALDTAADKPPVIGQQQAPSPSLSARDLVLEKVKTEGTKNLTPAERALIDEVPEPPKAATETSNPLLDSARQKLAEGRAHELTPDETAAFEAWRKTQQPAPEPPKQPEPPKAPEPAPEQPPVITPDIPPPPKPKTPKPSNIRVSEEQVAKLDREGANIAEARAAMKDAPPEQQQIFNQLADALNKSTRGETPLLEVTHESVEPETAKSPTDRTTRRAEQEANVSRKLTTKTLVPIGFSVTNDGRAQLFGMSADKVLAGANELNRDAARKGVTQKIPYALTPEGNFTPEAESKFYRDLAAYTANQANGYRGDGKELIRPAKYSGNLPARNENYAPVALPEHTALYLNTLVAGGEMGPPRTNRIQKDKVTGVPIKPKNIAAQELATANARIVQKPAIIEDPKKQTFEGFGVDIGETNPLRRELEAAGVNVRRNIIGAPEKLNLEHIKSVTERPEKGFQAPSPDITRAGFMPQVPRAFMPDPKGPVTRKSNEEARKVAAEYMRSRGLDYHPDHSYKAVPVEVAKRVADFYDQATNTPNDPEVTKSYTALAEETLAQYEAMKAAGVTIEPWSGEGEPYPNSAEMIKDVAENGHLYFLRTENAFGQAGEQASVENPMLAPTDILHNGDPLLVNDVFRAVHDYFGHVKEGNQFGPRGEYNAWRNHSEMFSDEAQGALAAETLAQNFWVNYGPQMRDAEGNIRSNVPLSERSFAEQKNLVVPPELIAEAKGAVRFMPARTELGKKIEDEQGLEFTHTGQLGARNVTVARNGDQLGSITSYAKSPQSSKIGMVHITKAARGKGLGEALYRELLTQLQKDGVTELGGSVIDPAPINIRNKIFGGIEKLIRSKREEITPEQALAELSIFRARDEARLPTEIPDIQAFNKIDPMVRYMPTLPEGTELPLQFTREGDPLPNAAEGPIKVVHYSSRDLQQVDPKMFGKAFATRNDLRGDLKSYFFVAGSPLGRDKQFFGEGGKEAYGARIDGSSLYDLSAGKPDPLKWGSTINRLEADENVQNAGYAGILVDTGADDGRKVVMMFKPVDVFPLGRQGEAEAAVRFMPGRQSTRVPWSIRPEEDASKGDLTIGLEPIERDPHVLKRAANVIGSYDLMKGVKGTPKEKVEEFKNRVVDNLLWLHDQFPEEQRQRAKLWYDGARRIVDDWSTKYGRTPEAISAVIAVMSPQRDWFQNVSLAKRVLEAGDQYENLGATQAQLQWLNQMDNGLGILADEVRGKKFQEMGPLGKAAFLRSHEHWYGSDGYRVVLPEGEFGDYVTSKSGERAKIQWGSFDQIARAFEVMENPDHQIISDALGAAHKVRNFYNNILNPKDSEHGDVTIDTHAVAAGLLEPLAGETTEVLHNFGYGAGSPNSASHGVRGTYGIYADAYREAAAKRGLLPREMQSITWEAVRALFKDTWKTPANLKLVKELWNEYTSGTKTLDEVRGEIKKAAGGFKEPDWVKTLPRGRGDETPQNPNDARELPLDRFRETELQTDARGGRNNSVAVPAVKFMPQPFTVRRAAGRPSTGPFTIRARGAQKEEAFAE